MKQQLLLSGATFIVALTAAIIVMVSHELFKAIAYLCYIKIYNKKYNKLILCPGVFKVYRYIDPVGMILAISEYNVFSKPYPYIIKSKKAAIIIGLIGYSSILSVAILAIIGHNYLLPVIEISETVEFFLHGLFEYTAYFAIMCFVANLYPLVSSDMALMISAISPISYIKLHKYDVFYKLVFIVLSLLSFFKITSLYITTQFLIS